MGLVKMIDLERLSSMDKLHRDLIIAKRYG